MKLYFSNFNQILVVRVGKFTSELFSTNKLTEGC